MSLHTESQKIPSEKNPRLSHDGRYALATIAVCLSMICLFLVPHGYFVLVTFVATSVMISGSYLTGNFPANFQVNPRKLALGLVSAALLYGVFYLGNIDVHMFPIQGVGATSESSIYSLISSPSNPLALQVVLLLFDAAGYELFFRGVLQKSLNERLGLTAAPAVALFDALLHLATLNPLWVATTFIADLCWGLTYRYGHGLQASLSSHYLWDLTIFILRPIA